MSYRIATFVLGLVIGGYWLRVIRMARKARRKTGRAANFLPAEWLGRLVRIIWAPVVGVWIVQPFATTLVLPRHGPFASLSIRPWFAWPMVAIAAGCLWLSRICWRTMGKNWRMGIDPGERTALVVSGPYRYVRHPIYALSQIMMVCTIAAIPTPLMIAAGVLHLLLLQWEARREEAYLCQIHGRHYSDYCATVGRFIPIKYKSRTPIQDARLPSRGTE